MEEVVKQRLAPLGNELIDVLRVAALMGEEFIFRSFVKLGIQDEPRLFAMIRKAEETGIVRRKRTRDSRPLYSFDDEVTIDILVANLSPETLVAEHRKIGLIMEKAYLSSDERAAELAFHFQKGEDWKKCFEYSTKSGDTLL